jgi:uncharacterized membrane protein
MTKPPDNDSTPTSLALVPGDPERLFIPQDPFRVSWRERVAVLGSVVAVLAIVSAIGFILRPRAMLELVALFPPTFFAAGKFLPLWGITGQSQFGPYELGLYVWMLDTMLVIALVYGIQLFYRIGPLKRGLDQAQTRAGLVLIAYPSMRRAAIAGVFFFVLFPIAGTGAVGATFIGILLGLHRVALIVIVSSGGLVGGLGMAFAASNFRQQVLELEELQEDPTLKYLIVGAVLLALVVFMWWASRVYQRAVDSARSQAVASKPDPS